MKPKEIINLGGEPEFLLGVLGLIAYSFDLIPKIYIEILWIILLVSLGITIWLKPKLRLIEEIQSSMKFLKEPSLVTESLTNPWKTYFEKKQETIYKNIEKYNSELDILISNRCCLLCADKTLIEKEFDELLSDINIFYKEFAEKVKCENIVNYDKVEQNRTQFINALLQSQINILLFLQSEKKKRKTDHDLKLKGMIQGWQNNLPIIYPSEEIRHPKLNKNEFDILFIKRIETLPFFEDRDIFYHCQDLELLWNNFKNVSNDYKNKKKALQEFMKKDIIQKLKTLNVNLGSDSDGIYLSIFRECIIKADNRKSGYRVFVGKEPEGDGNIRVRYCNVFDGGSPDDINCYELAKTKEPDEIVAIYNELIEGLTAYYINQINELIITEGKLRKAEDILNQALDVVRLNPSRMDCNYVKLIKEE